VVTRLFPACYGERHGYDKRVPTQQNSADYWAGKQIGLPAKGSRSVAQFSRRLGAIAIDWAIASGVGWLAFGGEPFAILGAFAVLQVIFIATLSGSIGHLLLGMRVVPINPRWIGVLRPLARTVLLCLVIPAFIWDKDERGLHDLLAGTVLVRK